MKNTLLLLPLALLSGLATAQKNSGTITYQQVMSLEGMFKKEEGNAMSEALAAMMPKEQKVQKVLHYSEAASLYENDPKKPVEEENISQGNMQVQFRQESSDEKIYTDLKTRTRIEQKELMGRLFLVTDSVAVLKWKFTGRQKHILGHPCMEAITAGGEDNDTLTAWYTTDIPVSTGPEMFSGLPGIVLEAQVGSSITLTAKTIDEKDVSSSIKAPAKGKKISGAAFRELAIKKQEEMRKQYGGDGNVIIRTTTR